MERLLVDEIAVDGRPIVIALWASRRLVAAAE
jgi:hypothetical protein